MPKTTPNKISIVREKFFHQREPLNALLDQIQPDDLESLLNALRKCAISDSDVDLLADAIRADKSINCADKWARM